MPQEMAPWSRWLRRYRDERDLTQEELGRILGVEGKTVSAWENGQRPGRRHGRNLCTALRTTRAELGLAEAVMERRTFLRNSVGLGALAVFGPWAGMDRLDGAAADAFESTGDMLWQLAARAGSAAALGPALGHVESIGHLLEGSLPSSLRPRLCRALAEGAALTAALKSWMGDAAGAAHFARLAESAAAEARDPDVAAHVVLVRTATDPALRGRADARLRSLEGAAGAAPATRVRVLAKTADAHASLGGDAAARRALDEAAGALAGIGSDWRRMPVDARWLSGERGATLARLGRVAEARAALDEALAPGADVGPVDRLWLRLASARTYAHQAEHGEAAGIALTVLRDARRFQHGQLEDEVGRLRRALRPSDAAVRSLDEALAAR